MASPARASRGPEGEDREVLFCHECQNRWDRVDESLTCPRCQGSFTEIINNLNNVGDSLQETGSPFFAGLPAQPAEPRPGAQGVSGDVVQRFTELLIHDLGAGRLVNNFGAGRAPRGSPGSGGLFPAGGENAFRPVNGVQHTTVRTGPFGGRTSITVTNRTMGGGGGGPDQSPLDVDTLFDQIFGNPWDERGRMPGSGPDSDPFAMLGRFQLLLATLSNPGTAAHGDAVFSQEALDRVVTQLMEAAPLGNAAPPATYNAIRNLQKKQVDDEMLGPEGKAECTICIDDINKGDQVLVLPCKHWYHGACVTLWLKEHNTCPICRTSIENPSNENPGGGSPPPGPSVSSAETRSPPGPSVSSAPTRSPPGPTVASASSRTNGVGNSNRFRTARENVDRLDSIRNLATGVGQPSSSSSQRRSSRSPRLPPAPQSPPSPQLPPSPQSVPDAWPLPSESAEMVREMARSRSASRERVANGAGDDTTSRARPVRMTSAMAQGVVSWGGGRQLSQSQLQPPPPQQLPPPPQYYVRPPPPFNMGNGVLEWLRNHFGRRTG